MEKRKMEKVNKDRAGKEINIGRDRKRTRERPHKNK